MKGRSWLNAVNQATGGWGKWLMAPAIVGVSAVVYVARSGRRRRERREAAVEKDSIRDQPALDSTVPSSAAPLPPLPQIQANLGAVSGEHAGPGNVHDVDLAAVSHSEIASPVFPVDEHELDPIPSPTLSPENWELPAPIPAGRTTHDEVIAGFAPNPRAPVGRRAVFAAAIVVVTAGLVYAALGKVRSHTANSVPPVLQTADTSAKSLNDFNTPAIDPNTLPVMPETTAAAPAAEGPPVSPSPSATVAADKEHHRKHRTRARARHPRSIVGKTRAFLRKTF